MHHSELPTPTHHFAMAFTSTPRGARLSRHLCAERLDRWGIPYDTDAHDVVSLITAELCANAVSHGRVPGRDFHVQLTANAADVADVGDAPTTVRIEVSDTRGECLPHLDAQLPGADADMLRTGGRGLLLVEVLAERWGVTERVGAPGKTVWAQYTVGSCLPPTARQAWQQ